MVLAILIVSLAQTANTYCTPGPGGSVQCTTTGQQPVMTPRAPAPSPESFGTFRLDPQMLANMRSRNIQKRIGELMAKGDCAGAEAYALKSGELGLVPYVREYCRKKD